MAVRFIRIAGTVSCLVLPRVLTSPRSRVAYFYHDGKDKDWENLKKDDIRRYRNAMVSHLKDVEASGDHLVWTPDYLKERGGTVKRGIILTGGEGVGSIPP